MSSSALLVATHAIQSIAVATFMVLASLSGGQSKAAERRAAAGPPTVRTITEHLKSKAAPYVATLAVPQLVWPGHGPVADRVNVAIVKWLETQVRQFGAAVRADRAPVKGLPESNLHVAYQVSRLDVRVLSVHLTVEAYVRGQASPSQVPAGLTFSLTSGRPYRLATLFRRHAPYLDALGRLVQADLKNFHPAGAHCYVGPTGSKAKVSPFPAWWLTRTALVLGYPAGRYTAAYCGPPTVTIAATAIAGLLSPTGPLAG